MFNLRGKLEQLRTPQIFSLIFRKIIMMENNSRKNPKQNEPLETKK